MKVPIGSGVALERRLKYTGRTESVWRIPVRKNSKNQHKPHHYVQRTDKSDRLSSLLFSKFPRFSSIVVRYPKLITSNLAVKLRLFFRNESSTSIPPFMLQVDQFQENICRIRCRYLLFEKIAIQGTI